MMESNGQGEAQLEKTKPDLDEEEHAWSPKDYVTVVLSTLAFVVSAISAYFNILRIEDNISIAVQFRAFATKGDQDKFSISSREETPVVFINSGNRPVAILSLDFVYIQAKRNNSPECTGNQTTVLRTDFDTLIVKPNDFAVKRIKITNAVWYPEDHITKSTQDNYTFPISSSNRSKSKIPIEVCAVVVMTTPAEARYYANVSIHKYTAEEAGRWSYASQAEGDTSDRPRVLVRKVSTRFE